MWILIYWVMASGPYGSTNISTATAEFTTEAACRSAVSVLPEKASAGLCVRK
jgi:hypothetical protein